MPAHPPACSLPRPLSSPTAARSQVHGVPPQGLDGKVAVADIVPCINPHDAAKPGGWRLACTGARGPRACLRRGARAGRALWARDGGGARSLAMRRH